MSEAAEVPRPHLLQYLPAIYQEADPARPQKFLGQFLLAFEALLLGGWHEDRLRNTGVGDGSGIDIDGLGEQIADLHTIFDPLETLEEFLPWLAGWAALSLRADMAVNRKRKLIAHIIPLYRIRGTLKYLKELLTLCLDVVVQVSDTELPAFQVDRHSTVGSDTYLGGGAPYLFKVTLIAPQLNASALEAQSQLARAVIELGKPAHTDYQLIIASHVFQLGAHSTVGVDTVLGRATT
jgi:phage tail-like protein